VPPLTWEAQFDVGYPCPTPLTFADSTTALGALF